MAAEHEPKVTYLKFDEMLAIPKSRQSSLAWPINFHVPLARQAIAAANMFWSKTAGRQHRGMRGVALRIAGHELGFFKIGNNARFDPGVAFAHRFIQEEMGRLMALKAWVLRFHFRYTMTDNLQAIVRASAQCGAQILPATGARTRGDFPARKRAVSLICTPVARTK